MNRARRANDAGPDRLLTVLDVADAFGITERTIREYVKEGALEAVRVGRLIRIRRSAFERFLRARSTRRKWRLKNRYKTIT
jgi:excisionase family DNA binding protein